MTSLVAPRYSNTINANWILIETSMVQETFWFVTWIFGKRPLCPVELLPLSLIGVQDIYGWVDKVFIPLSTNIYVNMWVVGGVSHIVSTYRAHCFSESLDKLPYELRIICTEFKLVWAEFLDMMVVLMADKYSIIYFAYSNISCAIGSIIIRSISLYFPNVQIHSFIVW